MGTIVSVHVVGVAQELVEPKARLALAWFERVEVACSRFRADSELRLLGRQAGRPVVVSPLLFQALSFALAVAESSEGAFDPTVGAEMEARGFNLGWQSGEQVQSDPAVPAAASWRDIVLDETASTVTLATPMRLDLGAVAKGLAIDLAARELSEFANIAIYAGGDLFVRGRNGDEQDWSIGIRHPNDAQRLLRTLTISDCAVCTSGNYERREQGHEQPHLIDRRTSDERSPLASATVVAPTAMVADALATAAFVLGVPAGLEFLEHHNVNGLLVTQDLTEYATAGMESYRTPAAVSNPVAEVRPHGR